MLHRAVMFIAAASVSIAYSGISQAAPIAPFPAALTTNTGNLTPVYYYRYHHRYHPRYYYHRHYRHYRY
jgi:hypothetical protein